MSSDRHLGNAVPAFGKSVWMLCIALFFVAYAAQTVSPVMLFYTVDLRLSTTDLTLFFTVYAIGLMIAFLVGGPESDRRGRKSIVLPSAVLLVLALLALLAAAVWGERMIFIARFIQGGIQNVKEGEPAKPSPWHDAPAGTASSAKAPGAAAHVVVVAN